MILQGAFFLCVTPYFVVLLLHNVFNLHISDSVWFTVLWLCYSNSTVNPYLYLYLNKGTERAYKV
jgi:hypothetical protein